MIGRKYCIQCTHIVCINYQYRLLDTFEVYFQQYLQSDLPVEYINKFPEELTVGQAVSCWKEILQYQIKYEANVGYTH